MLRKTINYFIQNKILFFIIFLAAVLRFALPNTPPALNWDEVSHGYNAYSILTTGRDEWGKFLPVIFRAYGDYKLPVYIYFTAVSEFFFGLTTFAVRLPSILAGIGTVIFTYFLTLELIKRIPYDSGSKYNTYATIAAVLVAIEPWSFFLSRAAFEANLALFLFISGIYYFIKFVNHNNFKSNLLLSSLLLGLTVWTYNSYRIFTPLMLLSLCLIYKKELVEIYRENKRLIILSSSLLSLFIVPMLLQLLNPIGQARYSWVGIIDQGSVNKINEARGSGCSRLICNKYTYIAKEFGRNYISHFSPNFLFLNGGTQYQFSVPGQGILYLVNFPLILFAIFSLFSLGRIDNKLKILLLSWIVLSPIPSSLTRESPHVLRFVTSLPIPMILTAMGLYFINIVKSQRIPKFGRMALFVGLIVYLVLSGEYYIYNYFNSYRNNYSSSWQYGYEQVSDYISENYSNYEKIIITKKYGEPHEFLLFNLKWNPDKYVNDPNLNRFHQTNWYWVDGFDKFYFVNDWQIPKDGNIFIQESKRTVDCNLLKCLLVTSPNNVPSGWHKLETINFLDGKPAFELYEN